MGTVSSNWPLVSVYIVNRNYGRYLKQAIGSAMAQDYPNVELIVVDDASDDCSAEVLAEFNDDPRLRILRMTENRGLTACCNAALRVATGDFVMRLDADDYLESSACAMMAAALVAEPAAVLVFPDYIEVDGRGAVIRHVQRHDFNALDSLSDLPAHGACTMVRRSFLDRFGGYDETINRQDGLDLWLSVGPDDRVLKISEPLFYYRQHGSNLTRDERALLKARAALIAKHVARKALSRPRVLGIVPVRGKVVDPGSEPLRILGDRPLIDWTLEAALSCEGIDRVMVSSPDPQVLEHVTHAYGDRIGSHTRDMDLAGLNVSLAQTLSEVLAAELDQGRDYDALLVLSVESPFRSAMFMQQAIDVMQLFDADGVAGVRHEDEVFFRHDGLGLRPVRADARLRLERDDLFRACGGLRLIKLPPLCGGRADYLAAVSRRPERLGHVLLDQLAAFGLRSGLDWEIAQHLGGPDSRHHT